MDLRRPLPTKQQVSFRLKFSSGSFSYDHGISPMPEAYRLESSVHGCHSRNQRKGFSRSEFRKLKASVLARRREIFYADGTPEEEEEKEALEDALYALHAVPNSFATRSCVSPFRCGSGNNSSLLFRPLPPPPSTEGDTMTTLYELVDWEDLGYNLPQSFPYPAATTIIHSAFFKRPGQRGINFLVPVAKSPPQIIRGDTVEVRLLLCFVI